MGKDVDLGRLLREKRLERGWAAEDVGKLYGNAVRGKPLAEGSVFLMEEGLVPKDLKRRWILSRIFGIAPTVMGLKAIPQPKISRPPSRRTRPVNIEEYREALLSYWTQGYKGQPETALIDLEYRINSLHDAVLYVSSTEKDQMKRLLCGYHMRKAEVARELSYDRTALDHVNKAIILAKENGYADLAATALYRRGEIAFDKWNLQTALRDFNAGLTLDKPSQYPIPSSVKGRILLRSTEASKQ